MNLRIDDLLSTSYATFEIELKRIENQLPELGKALFNKVFSKKSAHRLYKKFRQQKDDNKIITVTAKAILP